MSFNQGDTLYANGDVPLWDGADPDTAKQVKMFSKGDKIGEIYGVYPYSDGSGNAYSTDGGYVSDANPITNSIPSVPPASGMFPIGSDLYTTSDTNFRAGASTTSDIQFTVNPGYVGTVNGYGGDGTWYQVTTSEGDKGYVKTGSYLSKSDPATSGASAKPGAKPTPKKTGSGNKKKSIAGPIIWLIVLIVGGWATWNFFLKPKEKKTNH